MDESSMFPGFGRPDDHDRTEKRTRGTRTKQRTGEAKACADTAANPAAPAAAIAATAPPRCPEDCVSPAPFVPVTLLDHTHLAAHTFDHLEECPFLGITAAGYVEECLRTRRRFPHTLIVGPADSSKRTIARTIAAEMAAPVHMVEFSQLRGPDALHHALKDVPAGAVVIVGGLESACCEALSDIASVMNGRRPARERGLLDLMRDIHSESWKRGPRRAATPYADFTMILISRENLPPSAPIRRAVQLQYFTKRDAATEQARLKRLFRHSGCSIGTESAEVLASIAVDSRIRTLQVANVINTFAKHVERSAVLREPVKSREPSKAFTDRETFEALFANCIDPRSRSTSPSSIGCAEPPEADEAA
jgi:hypothetical protein